MDETRKDVMLLVCGVIDALGYKARSILAYKIDKPLTLDTIDAMRKMLRTLDTMLTELEPRTQGRVIHG